MRSVLPLQEASSQVCLSWQDLQLPLGMSVAQWDTWGLPSSAGELPLILHKQMKFTQVSPDMELAFFAQMYAPPSRFNSQPVGHYYWSTVRRICVCRLKMVTSVSATAQLYGHGHITLQDHLWPRNSQMKEKAAFLSTHVLAEQVQGERCSMHSWYGKSIRA